MEEEFDSSPVGFPVLSGSLEEDLPLQLCRCPYCLRSHWVIARPDYYFTCPCGGLSIFDGLTMRAATSAEYRSIRNKERIETVGFA
jgi:hypothetical protein